MPSRKLFRPLWPLLVALVLAVGPMTVSASAQQSGMSQAGTGSNPTAQSVTEQQLLQELQKIEGRVTQVDGKLALLEQPQGRDYRAFHESALPWIAGILILGMLIALALFYFVKGRIRMDVKAGVTIQRFNWFERFNHWMTATAFIILAITGLNYFFGKRLLMPLIGADAFATWSYWAKYTHNFIAWPFMLGLLLMLVMWIKDNLPSRYDWAWLKTGGFFGRSHPPADRFNAGQKLMFWSVILGGIALSASGIVMLFPFSFADINGMQWAQYIHAIAAVVMIAIILGHIYIGSIGMEGAYQAMGRGEVDLAWAREHHSIWVQRQEAKHGLPPPRADMPAAAPAA